MPNLAHGMAVIASQSPGGSATDQFEVVPQGTAPTWSQVLQAAGSAPHNWTWAPQGPNAGATNATNGTPGSAVVELSAPVNGGAEALLIIEREESFVAAMGPLNGSPTFGAIYLGNNMATPAIQCDGATNFSIGLNSEVIYLSPAASQWLAVFGVGSRGTQLGYPAGGPQFGGGDSVVGIHNCFTPPNPATPPTGGGVLYAEGGALKWMGPSGTITVIGAA
jgi:hypothetical protein